MTINTFATEMMAGFSHLNIVDLLVAREQYHVFLTKHPNVVATAIGRYLIRNEGVDESAVRTLANSHVDLDKSWPCVLVFVDQWQSEQELVGSKSPGAVEYKKLAGEVIQRVEEDRVTRHAEDAA